MPSTARMAPIWMTMVKSSAAALSLPSPIFMSRSAMSRWPVELTGRYSVRPSTTPSTTAFGVVSVSEVVAGSLVGLTSWDGWAAADVARSTTAHNSTDRVMRLINVEGTRTEVTAG